MQRLQLAATLEETLPNRHTENSHFTFDAFRKTPVRQKTSLNRKRQLILPRHADDLQLPRRIEQLQHGQKILVP